MLLLVITAYHAMVKGKRLCAHGRPRVIVNCVYDYFNRYGLYEQTIRQLVINFGSDSDSDTASSDDSNGDHDGGTSDEDPDRDSDDCVCSCED